MIPVHHHGPMAGHGSKPRSRGLPSLGPGALGGLAVALVLLVFIGQNRYFGGRLHQLAELADTQGRRVSDLEAQVKSLKLEKAALRANEEQQLKQLQQQARLWRATAGRPAGRGGGGTAVARGRRVGCRRTRAGAELEGGQGWMGAHSAGAPPPHLPHTYTHSTAPMLPSCPPARPVAGPTGCMALAPPPACRLHVCALLASGDGHGRKLEGYRNGAY